jgi:hypothetical protein
MLGHNIFVNCALKAQHRNESSLMAETIVPYIYLLMPVSILFALIHQFDLGNCRDKSFSSVWGFWGLIYMSMHNSAAVTPPPQGQGGKTPPPLRLLY